jgi:hypothetical protein
MVTVATNHRILCFTYWNGHFLEIPARLALTMSPTPFYSEKNISRPVSASGGHGTVRNSVRSSVEVYVEADAINA